MGGRPGPHDLAYHLDLVYLRQIRLDERLASPQVVCASGTQEVCDSNE
jgi:hypothetical protein